MLIGKKINPKLAKMKIDDYEKKWRQENNIEIIYPIENTNKQDLDKNIKYRNNFFFRRGQTKSNLFLKIIHQKNNCNVYFTPDMGVRKLHVR